MGRPSEYSEAVTAEICSRLAEGDSLRKICSEDGMPNKTTVLRWLDQQEAFRTQYARARELQADHYAEEIIDIADEDPVTVFNTEREAGGEEIDVQRVDGAAVQHQRLRIDARKWYASKVAPKKYGERLEHAGEIKGGFALNVNLSKASA